LHELKENIMKLPATLTALGLVTATAVAVGLPGGSASASDNRFSLTAQGDSQYYQLDGEDIPGSPKNSAGSLTANAHLDSTGKSESFAAAPYYGSTATTLPGLVNGAAQQFGYMEPVFPFAQFPGYVTASYPSEPENSETQGYYKVLAQADENTAAASGSNGAPDGIPAPNRQQAATAAVENSPTGTIAVAEGSAAGFVQGPLEVGYSHAKAAITDAGGAPKIESSVFGRFSISGQAFGFDKNGFTYLGQSQDKKAALDGANSALKAAGIEIEVAPETTETDPVSGVTTYTLGGLKITNNYTTPTGTKGTIGYILGRVQVASVNAPIGATVASFTSDSAATFGAVADRPSLAKARTSE
jgi:hypothetical protein